MQIGILGATGPAGSGLAARLASVGFDVVVGSRSKYRALEVRDTLVERWPDHDLSIAAADNEGAASADVVVIATPWDAAGSTAAGVADRLRGKVVISMANALAKVGHEFQPLVPHHVPAKELGHLGEPVESDVLVCSDHPEATRTVIDIVSRIPDLRPLDAGELSNAAPIEAFAAVLLQLNVRYKTRVAVRFTGLHDL